METKKNLKVSGLRQFLAAESPLKMMKNAFYFTLISLFVLKRYLNFCFDFLFMEKNGLIRKIRLISNFMTSQPRKQTIAIHIIIIIIIIIIITTELTRSKTIVENSLKIKPQPYALHFENLS